MQGVAIDPTCINIEDLNTRNQPNGRWLERTEPKQMHFKWGSRVYRQTL